MPSRQPAPGGPTGPDVLTMHARRLPSRVLDATNSYLVSLCLADECYRPNCQRVWFGSSRTHRLNTGFAEIAGEFTPLKSTRRHRPESGAFGQLTPAVIRPSVSFARQGYYTGRDFRVKSPSDFFQSRSRWPAGSGRSAGGRFPHTANFRPSKWPDMGQAKAMIQLLRSKSNISSRFLLDLETLSACPNPGASHWKKAAASS